LSDGGEVWRLGDLNPPAPGAKYNRMYRIIASPAASPDVLVVPTMRVGPVIALKPGATGMVKTGSPFIRWRIQDSPDVSSPLMHDGLVYLCRETRGGASLLCLDAKTGQTQYEEKVHTSRYRASPVYADGKMQV